jgi:hypothetical protein
VTSSPNGDATSTSGDASSTYEEGVVQLLGVLAYSELCGFERLAADAGTAPTIADQAALGGMATAEFRHFAQLRDALVARGADADTVIASFAGPVREFHERTAPADWLESLVKAYVGDGIAVDFYREVAALVDDDTRALVLDVFEDTGHADFVLDRVREAIAADPRVGGRLALWGRRLVGEALSQAQRVVAHNDALAHLLVGDGFDRAGVDLAEIGRMFARMTENHTRRMNALGLSA